MNSRTLLISAVFSALALSACATSTPRAEPKRLLLSYEGPAAAVAASARPRLVVRAVGVPDYLDRRELLRRVNESEIARDPTALWAERPGKSITRWVTQALAAQRPDYALESFTTADGRPPDAVLALTLDRFEPAADGTVRLRGSWVFAANGKQASQSGRFDADAPTSGSTAEASVAALQLALATAVKQLASELPGASFSAASGR